MCLLFFFVKLQLDDVNYNLSFRVYIYMRIINIKREIPFSSRGGGGRRVASYIYEIIYTRNCMGACVCVCDRRH